MEKSRRPTNKWIVTQVAAVGALVTAWLTAGEWGTTLSVTAIGILTQAIVSYVAPNTDSPGGVPLRAGAASLSAGH
ncbi:MAG TPA: hypothetical protein VIU11_19835 [Nakamurella sp.]